MRYKIDVKYTDDGTESAYIVQNSFKPSLGYVYTATLEDGSTLYINRQSVKTIIVSEEEG